MRCSGSRPQGRRVREATRTRRSNAHRAFEQEAGLGEPAAGRVAIRARRIDRAVRRAARSRVSVTVCTPRIVRVDLAGEGADAGPSYVGPRDWPGAAVRPRRRRAACGSRRPTSASRSSTDAAAPGVPRRRGRRWLLREPADGGMAAEPSADGRTRVHARFAFAGEQHFYGLGQGGAAARSARASAGSSGTRTSATGPGSDMGVPLLLSNRGYALFFDNPSDARAHGRALGQRGAHRLHGGRRAAHLVLPDRRRPARRDGRGGRAARPRPAAAALGARASSSRPATSTTRRSCASCRARSGTSASRATALIYLSTLRRGAGLEPRRRAPRVPARALAGPGRPPRRRRGRSTSRSSPTSTRCSTRTRRCSPRPRRAATSSTAGYERVARAARAARDLPRGPALPRLLQPGRARAGGGRPTATWCGSGVAGWWLDGGEGPPATAKLHAGDGDAAPQHLRPPPPPGVRRGRGGRPPRPARVPALPVRRGRDAALRRRRAGRATSTTTSRRSRRRSRWGSTRGCPGCRTGAPTSAASSIRSRRRASSTRAGSSSAPSARSSARTAGSGASTCRGRTAPRWRRSAAATPSCATGCCRTPTRSPGRRTRCGLPLMRPLVLNYPDDPRVWTLGHEFLWGDDLLVAPVTREGATAWPVYLPAGRWYDFWTGARHEGPGGVTLAGAARPAAAPRAGRRDRADGPGRPAHRRAAARRGDAADLPGAARHASSSTRTTAGRTPTGAGRHALTPIECAAEPGARDGADRRAGGRPVGRAGRPALPAPAPDRRGRPRCAVDGHGELPRLAGPGAGRRRAGGSTARVHPRPPARPARRDAVTVRTTT